MKNAKTYPTFVKIIMCFIPQTDTSNQGQGPTNPTQTPFGPQPSTIQSHQQQLHLLRHAANGKLQSTRWPSKPNLRESQRVGWIRKTSAGNMGGIGTNCLAKYVRANG